MIEVTRPPPQGSHPPLDLTSLFLGPKGENADEFERLLLEAFRDHVFWRRYFHPEDGYLVDEAARRDPAYERSISALRQALLGLLADLKAGVPFFSPRYAGHMCADLTMASVIGYFATMLYNPNNVAAEASPVTSRMELEVGDQLARMVGYPSDAHWSHLTSGGTVANFEALWVARNVKYLPIAIRWGAAEAEIPLDVEVSSGDRTALAELDLWALLNIPGRCALDLLGEFRRQIGDDEPAATFLSRHSLAGLGYQEFGRRLTAEFGDMLAPGVILVPSTGHYSWEKICRALGIGSASLRHIPVDERFRMDVGALESTLETLATDHQPVIACVSVIGSTEESAVDRLDRIAELRHRAQSELGLSFHLHADAAYGGYAAAATWGADGTRLAKIETDEHRAIPFWPRPDTFDALVALEQTDSVTIDPHKLGFVPYPAGAICFADGRGRDLVAVDAPYLFHRGASEWGYIGRYIFEGSKPGAAAASVWLSHRVLPLDAEGYGRLIRETARGAWILHDRLSRYDWAPFRLALLPAPDINIVCFAVGHPELASLESTNDLVTRVYESMRAGGAPRGALPDYMVTKTDLRAGEYRDAALPIVRALGFGPDDYYRAGAVSVIRCTVMDPFLASTRGETDHVQGFIATLEETLERTLAAIRNS